MNQPRYILGVDPGKFGAIASLDTVTMAATVEDCPLDKEGRLDYAGMCRLVRPYRGDAIAIVEDVNSFGMGRQSAFVFGANVGAWRAVFAAFDIPVRRIAPSVWKPSLGLGKDKSEALEMARSHFPELAGRLRRKKDHDRAEALLLALWGMRSHPTPSLE